MHFIINFYFIFVELVTSLPTENIIYVDTGVEGTWNDGFQICCNMGGRIIQPDTPTKMQHIMNLQSRYNLDPELWIAAYDSQPGMGYYMWTDGTKVIYPNLSIEIPDIDENCLRLENFVPKDRWCYYSYHIICEVQRGTCSFDVIENQTVVEPPPRLNLTVPVYWCLQICLQLDLSSSECSFVVTGENNSCLVYTTDIYQIGSYSTINTIPEQHTKIHFKNCFKDTQIKQDLQYSIMDELANTSCSDRPRYRKFAKVLENQLFSSQLLQAQLSSSQLQVPNSQLLQEHSFNSQSSQLIQEQLLNCQLQVSSSQSLQEQLFNSQSSQLIQEQLLNCQLQVSSSQSLQEQLLNCQLQVSSSQLLQEQLLSSQLLVPSSQLLEEHTCNCVYTTEASTDLLQSSMSQLPDVSSGTSLQPTPTLLSHTITSISIQTEGPQNLENNILDVKQLSSFKRKLISIPDHRSSAITIGVVGIVCMAAFFLTILILDFRCKGCSVQNQGFIKRSIKFATQRK